MFFQNVKKKQKMLINEYRKFQKMISVEKEMLSKKTKKNYKRDLIQYLSHQVQHNQCKIKIRYTQAAIIQTKMKIMINLTTSSQKTYMLPSSPLQKKIILPKIINFSLHTFSRSQLSLLNRGPKFTPARKSNHFIFKDGLKKFTRRLHIKKLFKCTPFKDNSLVYNPSAKPVRTNNSDLQH